MLALAVTAALAVMAFVAAGSASAQEKHLVVICEVPTKVGELCPENKLYKHITVKAELEKLGEVKHAVLLGNVNELCEQSIVEGKTTQTSPVLGEITNVTFTTGCKPCSTVTVSGYPFPVEIIHDEEAGVHLWLLIATGKIRAKFTGCPFGVTCTFEAKEIHLDVENKETTPLVLTLENELTRVEGSELFCGNVGKWDANYLITSPSPAYLALDKKTEA